MPRPDGVGAGSAEIRQRSRDIVGFESSLRHSANDAGSWGVPGKTSPALKMGGRCLRKHACSTAGDSRFESGTALHGNQPLPFLSLFILISADSRERPPAGLPAVIWDSGVWSPIRVLTLEIAGSIPSCPTINGVV